MLVDLFLVSFSLIFLFVPCGGGGLSWLHVNFLLHVKYTVLYFIVLCNSIIIIIIIYYYYHHYTWIYKLTRAHSVVVLNQSRWQSLGGQHGKDVDGLFEKVSFQTAFEGVESG